MPRAMSYRKISLAVLLACWLAAPAAAYTIYLKDGSRILARSEYTVDGDRAIIVLESGTQTFLALAEIDVERTREANDAGVGNALIFEDGKFVERTAADTEAPERETLTDLIARGAATMRGTTRSDADPAAGPLDGTPGMEQAQRQPLRDIELTAALKAAFADRGLERAPIYEGTESGRPLVAMTADSEASVFHNLEVAAEVLLGIRETHAECDVLEIVMTTGSHERAGEFALTAEMAASLRDREIELSAFFVRHVRF
ncbi:MAG: hypothetical protein OES32_09365 [Acidobacteriota bacterium]|nr:hypothetical protein [Acidobacteriota bacterium]MDH3523781.1 hypothetical protein [Acidobacteriota bacterium]